MRTIEPIDEAIVHGKGLQRSAGEAGRHLGEKLCRLHGREGKRVDPDVGVPPTVKGEDIERHDLVDRRDEDLPARNAELGGNALCFATVGGPPNVADIDRGKRPGTLADFVDLVRLAQSFDVVQVISSAMEPLDVPPELRHIETTWTQLVESDKFPFMYARGRRVVEQSFQMMAVGHGISREEFEKRPRCFTVINTNSPLQLDRPMSRGIIDFARAGQMLVITPFTLAGAMAPVSLAGALVLQNAEALAGVALAQIVRPGAPVLYGAFTSNVDMKSGAPAFGTPEYVKAAIASGQLARRYNLPWRSSSTNASNWPDAQAVYESQMSLWGAVLGGANLIIHAAGWLEGGLTASFEKFIIDVEMLQGFAELFKPLTVDRAELALEAIQEVGPAGHFFGSPHTLERYQKAFYEPLLSDWRNYGAWQEAGAVDATRRANAIWKRKLAEFTPPPMDPAVREALAEYRAKALAAGGASLEE